MAQQEPKEALPFFTLKNVNRFFVDGKQINTRETAARIVLVDDIVILSTKTIVAAVSLVFENVNILTPKLSYLSDGTSKVKKSLGPVGIVVSEFTRQWLKRLPLNFGFHDIMPTAVAHCRAQIIYWQSIVWMMISSCTPWWVESLHVLQVTDVKTASICPTELWGLYDIQQTLCQMMMMGKTILKIEMDSSD